MNLHIKGHYHVTNGRIVLDEFGVSFPAENGTPDGTRGMFSLLLLRGQGVPVADGRVDRDDAGAHGSAPDANLPGTSSSPSRNTGVDSARVEFTEGGLKPAKSQQTGGT